MRYFKQNFYTDLKHIGGAEVEYLLNSRLEHQNCVVQNIAFALVGDIAVFDVVGDFGTCE